jgi:hypothetical protein
LQGAYARQLGRAFQTLRLEHLDTATCSELLYGTCHRLKTATGGPVGLGQHQRDFVSCDDQARQRPLSELGRAGED